VEGAKKINSTWDYEREEKGGKVRPLALKSC